MGSMKTLSRDQRCAVIRCLCDGVSIAATTRITGVAKNTIQKLTIDLGEAVIAYQDNVLRGITCKRIQCDEIWNFCWAKEKNLPDEMRGMPGVGSMWTWTAMDAQTKLIISWRLGARDAANANSFMQDVAELADQSFPANDRWQPHLSGRGSRPLRPVHRLCPASEVVRQHARERTYSPAKCLGTRRDTIFGEPDPRTFRQPTRNVKTSIFA